MPDKNPDYDVSFGEAFKRFWKNYANFSGRATRGEYWWWFLANFLISFAVGIIPVLNFLWGLATLIPTAALGFRRMHDVGRSGAWIFSPLLGGVLCGIGCIAALSDAAEAISKSLIAIGGILSLGFGIFVFVCTLLDSKPGTNRYGQSEKYPDSFVFEKSEFTSAKRVNNG